jgi:hypothetical protein
MGRKKILKGAIRRSSFHLDQAKTLFVYLDEEEGFGVKAASLTLTEIVTNAEEGEDDIDVSTEKRMPLDTIIRKTFPLDRDNPGYQEFKGALEKVLSDGGFRAEYVSLSELAKAKAK